MQSVNEVGIAWFRGDRRQAHFDIEVSMDGSTWSNVFSGSSSGVTIGLQGYGFADVQARYVRIVGHGNTNNDWNSITEVEVHRSFVNETRLNVTEVSASDFQDPNAPENTLDEDLDTRGSAEGDGQ